MRHLRSTQIFAKVGVGVLADLVVLVDGLDIVGLDSMCDAPADLALLGVLVLILEGAHVISNMLAKDVGAVNLGVETLVSSLRPGQRFMDCGMLRSPVTRIHSVADSLS